MSKTANDRRDAWSRYWRSGALHSCVGSWDDNYGGAIRAFWMDVFAGLERSRRLLDLGCGNGPLGALMATTRAAEHLPRVEAVDLAQPAPAWLDAAAPAVAQRFRFHGGVSMERLPFRDAEFDRVVSQFGFEYAERGAAVAEASRVLAPGGELALVCHHRDSRLAEVAAEECGHAEWLLQESGLAEALTQLLPYAARSGSAAGVESLRADAGAEAARRTFNACLDRLAQRARAASVPDLLHEVGERCIGLVRAAPRQASTPIQEAMAALFRDLRDSQLRSRELLAHALDDAAVQELHDAFTAQGVGRLHIDRLREGTVLLAWSIRGCRARAHDRS